MTLRDKLVTLADATQRTDPQMERGLALAAARMALDEAARVAWRCGPNLRAEYADDLIRALSDSLDAG